jgi:hypothetical protein
MDLLMGNASSGVIDMCPRRILHEEEYAIDDTGNGEDGDCSPKSSVVAFGNIALVLTQLALLDICNGTLDRMLCWRWRGLVLREIADLTHGESGGRVRVRRSGRMVK